VDARIFPNPIKQKGIIQYGVKETASIFIVLTDANAKTITMIESEIKAPGNYRQK